MKVFRRCAVVAAGIGALVATSVPTAGSAIAAPQDAFEVTLDCDNGESYDVVVTGNGEFTPARDQNSTLVLIPVAFGDFTGTLFDDEGNEVDSFTEEGTTAKGSGKQKRDAVCTFEFTEVSDGSDPEFPEDFVFVGSGSVVVKFSGRR